MLGFNECSSVGLSKTCLPVKTAISILLESLAIAKRSPADCLLTPRRLFLQLGGFDPKRFPMSIMTRIMACGWESTVTVASYAGKPN